MNKIYLDNNEFNVTGFNRYTQLNGDQITSYADVQFADVVDYSSLSSLVGETITSIRIKANDITIYNLDNILAKVSRINENMYNDKMNISAQIIFSPANE